MCMAAILFNGVEFSKKMSIPFQFKSHPGATEQISVQIDQIFGKRCRKLIFKMAAVMAILDSQSTPF